MIKSSFFAPVYSFLIAKFKGLVQFATSPRRPVFAGGYSQISTLSLPLFSRARIDVNWSKGRNKDE